MKTDKERIIELEAEVARLKPEAEVASKIRQLFEEEGIFVKNESGEMQLAPGMEETIKFLRMFGLGREEAEARAKKQTEE